MWSDGPTPYPLAKCSDGGATCAARSGLAGGCASGASGAAVYEYACEAAKEDEEGAAVMEEEAEAAAGAL